VKRRNQPVKFVRAAAASVPASVWRLPSGRSLVEFAIGCGLVVPAVAFAVKHLSKVDDSTRRVS